MSDSGMMQMSKDMEMTDQKKEGMKSIPTNRLLLMAGIHFVLMYAFMYAMVDQFNNVFTNLNQIYMAGIMTAPMLIMETVLMGVMYGNKGAMRIIQGISVVVLIVFFYFIRQQAGITDENSYDP